LIAVAAAALVGVVLPRLDASAATTAVTYQAESAALSGGAVAASDHTGYTGTGFAGGLTDANRGTAAVTFAVTVSPAGAYTSTLRYANGTGSARTLSVYVAGQKTSTVSLPATADWNTWATAATPVNLVAGSNAVAYRYDATDNANVNLDAITVAPAAAPAAGQYEAESAVLSGGAVAESDHTGFSGTGFAGGFTDGNKATAVATFTVTAAAAGTVPVGLRYANGTGSTRSLSVYVNGSRALTTSLAATADWNTWATQTENLTLSTGGNTISYRYDSTDNGNVNLDYITVGGTTTGPVQTAPGQPYQAETAFVSGGPSIATSMSGYTGTGYLTGFTAGGAETVIDTVAPAAGAYPLAVTYANTTGSAQTVSLYLNGIKSRQLSLPAASGWAYVSVSASLRSGLNLVGVEHDDGDTGNVAIDSVSVDGGSAIADQGATLPYTEFRAADASTTGAKLAASRSYPSPAAESTGRSAVQLTATGQYVQVTLDRPANAVVVRYSIPDGSGGRTLSLYAGGTRVTGLAVTDKYSWLYGDGYNDTNTADTTTGHHFYDEVRYLSPTTWAKGTVLKLQKDAVDTASVYTVDVVDTELVDAAYAMPAGYVSAATLGVTPGGDVTAALTSAAATAAGQGKGLFLPAGTYAVSGRVNLSGVSLRGAGEWRTVVQSTAENGAGGLYATGGRTQIADLTLAGDQTFRNNNQGAAAIEGAFAAGSLIFDVWMEHTKVGLWAVPGTGLLASGLRARDIFADGIHVHGGSSGSRVEQSSVRNTGDDGIALDTEGGNVTGCTVSHNSVQTPVLANGIGVYGGGDNVVENNAVRDTVVNGSGITVSSWFGQNFSGPTTVRGNLLQRTGSYQKNWGSDIGAVWIYAADQGDITQPIVLSGNTISDSTYQAVLLSYNHRISNVTVDRDVIAGAGTYAFDLYDVSGAMTFSNTSVAAAGGGINNNGSPGFVVTRGPGNSGF
jgi:Right handed beta helix region/Carbohydrate binding module (family 35)/Carbohydrate binding module (family 6)